MGTVTTWPAPDGGPASPDFTLEADGTPVFLYQAQVRPQPVPGTQPASDADLPSQRASFAIFDMAGRVSIVVKPTRKAKSAVVLPARARVEPQIVDGAVHFTLDRPSHLTLLINGDDTHALHFFIGEPEKEPPKPEDPNVIYLGPGVHEADQTGTISLKAGQTLYLAGGAILRLTLRPGDKSIFNEKIKRTIYPGVLVQANQADGVCIRGRGILDGSHFPHPGRRLVRIQDSNDVRVEGVVLREACNWNVTLVNVHHAQIDDVRIIGGRDNSDGIDVVGSTDISIRRCFVRNHDDGIIAKTLDPKLPTQDVDVADCVIWSDWGFAMGATYETRAPISRVKFRRCDVISCQHWCMGVHASDSGTVSDILFADIEIADLFAHKRPGGMYDTITHEPKLLRLVIQHDMWGKDPERGKIRDILVEDVVIYGKKAPPSEMFGADDKHDIKGVTFRHVRLDGQEPITTAAELGIKTNAFVKDVKVEAAAAE